MMDKNQIKIFNLNEQPNDFAFWQAQPFAARLKALATIRAEFNTWKYGIAEPRLQRVYRVVEQKRG